MKIRKVVIPAAGLGTRFLPATKAQPKEMLPIVDKPTIQYIVEEAIASGTPVLGICLGCQIMLEMSEENNTPTLGIVPGKCLAFDPAWVEEDGERIRVPHMGRNSLQVKRPSVLFNGIEPEAQFYFVHGYYPAPAEEFVLATTYYGREFCSVYGKDALWAVQFHPEKSGRPGLKMLSNFYEFCVEGKHA